MCDYKDDMLIEDNISINKYNEEIETRYVKPKKIYFKYGKAMGIGKTSNLIDTEKYDYRYNGFKTMIFTPSIDNRNGIGILKSRDGKEVKAIPVGEETDINELFEFIIKQNPHITFWDEVQFLPSKFVDLMERLTMAGIKVMCYGLLSNYKATTFNETINRLSVISNMEKIKKGVCPFCGSEADHILKLSNGKIVKEGETIEVGAEDKYMSVCRWHYHNLTSEKVLDKMEELKKIREEENKNSIEISGTYKDDMMTEVIECGDSNFNIYDFSYAIREHLSNTGSNFELESGDKITIKIEKGGK